MYSDDDKLEQVIHKWLESECLPPTWDTVIEVLERLQLKAVLREVTQFLTTDPEAVRKYNWKRTQNKSLFSSNYVFHFMT